MNEGTLTQSQHRRIRPHTAIAIAEDPSLYAVFSLRKDDHSITEAQVEVVNPLELSKIQDDLTKKGKRFAVLGEFPFLMDYDHPANPQRIMVQLTDEAGTPHHKREESLIKAMDMLGIQHPSQRSRFYREVIRGRDGDAFNQRIWPSNAERKSSIIAGGYSLIKFRKDHTPQRSPLR